MEPTNQIRPTTPSQIPITEYCLYARKSSEDDERQAMSIDSQIKEMNGLAIKDGLFIKEMRKESHSAKMSVQRPVFNQLLNDIRVGMFTGILTWAPDRLSRNSGDLGNLVDLMDQGKLQQIKTFSQNFSNNPNEKFLLYTGEFEYPVGSGNWYKGSYQPLITKEIYDKVQKQLYVPPKSKWGSKAFTFKGLFKCASCGSNLVGEDKYRQRKYGEPRYHVYYHCSRQINYDCPEDYISEEGLAKALFRFINFTYIAHPQIINLTQAIREGINEYKKVRDDVLLRQDINPDEKTMDVRDYARHVLSNGDAERKRQLIQLFREQLYLHDRKVVSSRVKKATE